ncbi:MAG TPA: aldolase [Spirochaetes bacterium]|nr:aldolase [Spirochaetota bacterium]
MKNRLRKKLWYLRESHGIIGVKGGTEVEDMSFEELSILKDVSRDMVPMIVKIGGPEARNDLRHCMKIGVEGILAPMVESDYGLNNFIETMKELAGNDLDNYYLAINLETITGYYNINSMIHHPNFQWIKQVTVGRTDLAGSMEQMVNHKDVTSVALDIVDRMRKAGKATSVGGKIDALSAGIVKNEIQPDRINTRHLSIDLSLSKNLTFSICEALAFEIDLYKLFVEIDRSKEESYVKRIEDTKARMAKREVAFIPTFSLTS